MSLARTPARTRRAPLTIAVVAALFAAPAAHAIDFQKGELEGNIDTTLSYGVSRRMEDVDQGLIGKSTINPLISSRNVFLTPTQSFPGSPTQVAAPGRFSVNRDDGNLKYDKGDLIANTIKMTSELSLKWRDSGAFARATYFYDFENAERDDLTSTARNLIGERGRWLDGFVFHNVHYGEEDGLTGSVRLGRQVISWGESTFLLSGINVVNPIDLSALRVAGAELKEAFLPVDSIWSSFQLSQNLSLEGFYLTEWEEIEIDASGTYFSAADHAGPGASYAMLGFGTTPQPVNNPELFHQVCSGTPAAWQSSDRFAGLAATYGPAIATQLIAAGCSSSFRRSENRNASDSGQYGVALRWLADGLGDTEFGFYYLTYHSRLPIISGHAATGAPGVGPGLGRPVPGASYFLEYPEDIDLFGLSWNTLLPGGIAWQGEISHRPKAPYQVDDVEILIAGLSSLTPPSIPPTVIPPALRFVSQLGQFTPGQYIPGYRELKTSQLQMTFTKAFGEVLGADQISLVGEIGATRVDLPPQSQLRFEAEGTDTSGGCDINSVGSMVQTPSGQWQLVPFPGGLGGAGCARNPLTLPADAFPTSFSWGYRLAARADYNAVFGSSINVAPRLAYNHDVNGTTPGPGGNFLEGRTSYTLGIEAIWQNRVALDLSYTGFTGAEPYNQIADRDFASISVKYSF